MESHMVDERYYTDPPRPANRTAAKWYAECREQEARETAAAEWRKDFKAMLARVHAARGVDGEAVCAMLVAIAGEDISLEEMERIGGILPVEQAARPPVRPAPVVEHRLPSERAEAAWLREARLEAETAWRATFPHTAPQRDPRSLSAEDLAFAEAAAGLAVGATSARREEDGRVKFRGDHIDADLYAKGAEMAKKYWPGW
jgi:hypothetical protein